MIEQIGIYNYKSIRNALVPLKRINILIGESRIDKLLIWVSDKDLQIYLRRKKVKIEKNW